jgi:ribosome-associated protein
MAEFEDYSNDAEEWEFEKSKTQVKRELDALKELGKQLVELPKRDLDKVSLPEALMDAVVSAQAMKKGALKRQLGYIGGLMTEVDADAIAQQLAQIKLPHQGDVKAFHQLEAWRDGLIAQDKAVLNELIAEFDELDIQHVRQLVRNAINEAKQSKPPKSSRLLFRYLQELQNDH